MKKWLLRILICACLLCCGCTTTGKDTVTQTSTIDALLAGVYDGHMSSGRLLEYGDFGLGTFDRLEGEMAVIDGIVYQVKADGRVYTPGPNIKTPFACVCRFNPDREFLLKQRVNYKGIEELVNRLVPNQNIFCAVRIRGKFAKMKTRSVPAQKKPYPPLAEVVKHQPIFHMENVSGTIVGFRCPPFVKGINVAGYHLHFISQDKKQGGHVLGFEMKEGKCDIDMCNKFLLILPERQGSFGRVDLSKDRSKELERVER